MPNLGVFPYDPLTPTGQFRVLYPDTQAVPLDPPVGGMADYEELSDADIEGFLALGNGSVFRAIATYYLQQAGKAAQQSKIVKDTDLYVSLVDRSEDLTKIAQEWFARADSEDVANGDADIFDSFRFGGDNRCGRCAPEAAPCPVNCGC